MAKMRSPTPVPPMIPPVAVRNPASAICSGGGGVILRIPVYLVLYDSGWVSLEHLLLSWYPSLVFHGEFPQFIHRWPGKRGCVQPTPYLTRIDASDFRVPLNTSKMNGLGPLA